MRVCARRVRWGSLGLCGVCCPPVALRYGEAGPSRRGVALARLILGFGRALRGQTLPTEASAGAHQGRLRRRRNRMTSPGQPAGVSPVRGDAWVPGSEAPARETGCEAGLKASGRSAAKAKPEQASTAHREVGREGAEPFPRRRRPGRRPRSRSGRRRTLRRIGSGMSARLSWELGRPSSAPPPTGGKHDRRQPATPGNGGVERESEGA